MTTTPPSKEESEAEALPEAESPPLEDTAGADFRRFDCLSSDCSFSPA
jgi:hypothetical protein